VTQDGASFIGLVQPEALGTYVVTARASTDGGETWQYADSMAVLEAVQGDDTEPPPPPSAPELVDVGGDRVHLRWAEPTVEDLHRYLVLRATEAAGPFTVIAITTTPTYLDASVTAGTPYAYAVQAQDTAFNTSQASDQVNVIAEERLVDVVFTTTVPDYTTDTVFIAGDFQGWNPAGTALTQLDDVTWAITLPFQDQESIQYKYARGTWDAVEKDDACAEIANRSVTTDYGTDGIQEVADHVARWRDLDECP